jgi:hypothetical protein
MRILNHQHMPSHPRCIFTTSLDTRCVSPVPRDIGVVLWPFAMKEVRDHDQNVVPWRMDSKDWPCYVDTSLYMWFGILKPRPFSGSWHVGMCTIYIYSIDIYIYVFIVHNDTIYGVLYTIFMFCMRVYLFRSTLLMKGMSTTAIFMGKMMMTHSNFWGALASRERHIYI